MTLKKALSTAPVRPPRVMVPYEFILKEIRESLEQSELCNKFASDAVLYRSSSLARSLEHLHHAEALIELLEVHNCGSVGGFDKHRGLDQKDFGRSLGSSGEVAGGGSMINRRSPIGEGSDLRKRGGHKIEWTDQTWNPVRGCSRVSEGCRNCYAEAIAARFSGSREWGTKGGPLKRGGTTDKNGVVRMDPFFKFATMTAQGPRWTGKVELIESKLLEPLHWRKPRRCFVNSMSDLFHENLPYPDILHVFQIMAKCPRHTFQILTKRPAKMRELLSLCWWRNLGHSPEMGGDIWAKVIAGEQRPGDQNFLPNIWLGVSVENQPTADERIPELLRTPAALRFVSYEPALVEIDFTRFLDPLGELDGFYRSQISNGMFNRDQVGSLWRPILGWGIIGGESGPGARPFQLEWAESTVDQFAAAGVPLFVKQIGSKPRQACFGYACENDPRKGGDPMDWPRNIRVRQFPVTALEPVSTARLVHCNP